MLSFSYSSFLALAFIPPVHIFFSGIRPDIAILADAAAYFISGWFMHTFIMSPLSNKAASRWSGALVTLCAALTAAGICFLFSAA
jgi:hypothetical protein